MKNKIKLCLLLLLLLGSSFVILELNQKKQEEKNYHQTYTLQVSEIKEKQDEIDKQKELEKAKEEILSLRKEYNNEDVVGTFEILNEDFKVPVVQTKDNDFYLKHLPNKDYSFMGSIFMDFRVNIDTSKKLLIYGHNSKDYQMPFYIIEKYYDEEYLNNHKEVVIKSLNKIRKYEIFSIFIETSDYSYMDTEFTGEDYYKHILYLQNKSMVKMDTKIYKNDNILLLQTCSTHEDYKKYKKKYLVLAFKEKSA